MQQRLILDGTLVGTRQLMANLAKSEGFLAEAMPLGGPKPVE